MIPTHYGQSLVSEGKNSLSFPLLCLGLDDQVTLGLAGKVLEIGNILHFSTLSPSEECRSWEHSL